MRRKTIFSNEVFAEIVTKIRKLFIKIRAVQKIRSQLVAICQLKGIPYLKPHLDVKTRWNSTFKMLITAFKLRKALKMLCQDDENLQKFDIPEDEWQSLEKLLPLLGNINYITNLLSHEKIPTLPVTVIAFNILLDKFENTMISLSNEKNKFDTALAFALQAGRDKLIKHYIKCNWIYSVSLILNPRHRYDSFDTTHWGKELKKPTVKKFENIYKNQYYKSKEIIQQEEITKPSDDDFFNLKSIYASKKKTEDWREEINRYLEYPEIEEDKYDNFDILLWWKNNSAAFPNLSKMARDILCTPASSVSVGRFFSTGSLIMTRLRCRLKDTTLRNLMLLNSWTKCVLKVQICESDILTD